MCTAGNQGRADLLLAAMVFVGLSGFSIAAPSDAAEHQQTAGAGGGDFFIISSVDIPKKQLVLKLPTEVTELMQVTEKTVFLNEHGKPLKFSDLRAGDTVFLSSAPGADGVRTVRRLRRGPMTTEELRRRYPTLPDVHPSPKTNPSG